MQNVIVYKKIKDNAARGICSAGNNITESMRGYPFRKRRVKEIYETEYGFAHAVMWNPIKARNLGIDSHLPKLLHFFIGLVGPK